MIPDVQGALEQLRRANPLLVRPGPPARQRFQQLHKVLVANRGEIAKRFFFVLKEEGIPSVAIVTDPDRKQSWYEFADEVVYIGGARNYTNIPVVLAAVLLSKANAVYPGYGFLSESHAFVQAIGQISRARGQDIVFLGPPAAVMRKVGNKLDARALAKAHGIPLLEGTGLIRDLDHAKDEAVRIGYPVMVKLNAGGGGKGMVAVYNATELPHAYESARRIGQAQYGDDALYLEKYVKRPVHIEVQIFNGMAVGIRKCAVQRRNQKIIEETGEFFLEHRSILRLLAAAESMAAVSGYADGGGAGTVEFLLDADTEDFGFLEVNTRLQVEYPVTDQSLGIDLAKWQVLYFDGREREIPYEQALRLRFAERNHAIECRIYAEDPWNNYAPSPGVIQDLDLPTFNGIRCDFGFREGDTILPDYDPMIGKLIARGTSRKECLLRLERALGELYVRGVTTNVDQLLRIVRHPDFQSGVYTNRLLDDADELRSPETDAERPVDAAVFCSLAELAHALHRTLGESLASGDLESILAGGTLSISPSLDAEVHGKRLRIDFLQLGLETYGVFVNNVYYGEMQISRRVEGHDDFLILFRGRSYPVRIDRRPSFNMLRVMEEDGRIHYYRIKLQFIGTGRKADSPGTVRSPFQSSFVKFASDRSGEPFRIGSRVERGDPLIVIEAMKMETVLASPVSGAVGYLVEEGDLSRLVRGRTSQGLVIGKPLTEGEILVIVEEESREKTPELEPDVVEIGGERHEILGRLREPGLPDGGLGEAARADPSGALPSILSLVRSFYLGYVQPEEIPVRLAQFLTDLKGSGIRLDTCEETITDILDVYSCLKQIYSPTLVGDQTWFGEMHRLLLEWENETFTPPDFFRSVMGVLLRKYGVFWSGGKRSAEMRLALFYILRAYAAIRDGRSLIASLLDLLLERAFTPPTVMASLRELVRQEQSERDDSLAGPGRALLSGAGGPEGGPHVLEQIGGAPPEPSEGERLLLDPFAALPGDDGRFRERALAALQHPEAPLLSPALPAWVRRELEPRLGLLSSRCRIDALPSTIPTVVVYRLTPLAGGAHGYATIGWVEEGTPQPETDPRGHIAAVPNVERAATHAGRLLAAYNSLDRGQTNLVEILACERPVDMDLAGSDPSIFQYENLTRLADRFVRLLLRAKADWVLLQVDARRPGFQNVERKVLHVYLEDGRPCLDLLHATDRRSPLWNGVVDEKNQRLFDRRKWPAELWAHECFDPGTAREILIESIDGISADGAASSKARTPVGCKIYQGLMAGRPAVFFFKDSRISGGATGDLEGRKYAAACYYAYLRDAPLYVWNDGAGANVRQGMVALNRAAEGFMMNALVAHSVSYDRFLSTVRSAEDPVLHDLFDELDRAFGLAKAVEGTPGPRAFFLAAISVGSSSGLDVYGSSQAAIQIILDSEQSYRVLTGSSVIRAVTGENLTNYDIGGARVMGQWTGTVDLVARDRIDLLNRIRSIHELFSDSGGPGPIARPSGESRENADGSADAVLNERRITANVDHGTFVPFKGEYLEAGALVGGFAKLGGRRVLVMGPRTHWGIRSFASVARAKELLQIANKTRSPKILVIGRKWYRSIEGEDEMAVRARMDFVRLIFVPGPPRVHIVTHPEGLLLVTLNSQADAVIYVRRAEDSEKDRRLATKTAPFEADSLAEAFDLANRVLGLLDGRGVPHPFEPPTKRPDIPADTSRPYDMITDVIEGIVDEASFLEFYGEGRKTGGSTLITGLATLKGKVAGVIADQPVGGGAPDAPGTEKFRVFMEFLERNGIPLVMLSNAPGFVPGTKQERLRIQQIGGESLDVNVLSRVPVVSVVLNQNFGGRQIHAFSRFLRPGIAYIALDRAILAVMGGPAAFDLFQGARYQALIAQGSREEADRLRNEFLDEFSRKSRADQDAMRTGVLDWTVPDLADLRSHVLRAMGVAEAKARAAFRGLTPDLTPRPTPSP
jgi:acetyl/propionyl-CoA carboxylase alpha subunit/acetyl-CoA carboxylase carboxyltransferase component